MTDEDLLAQFVAGTVPFDQWNHRAHVRVAYLLLRGDAFEPALTRFRTALHALNARHGTPEALDRGYHETLTAGFFRVIAAVLAAYGPGETSDAFCDQHPYLLHKTLLRLYYTRPRIMSWEAKRAFVEPDIAPLPPIPR
ncbi:MAG TPA: hypothetical protein VGM03_01205 [Phycisphaerae bacterium]|jgi:hypothetical protein